MRRTLISTSIILFISNLVPFFGILFLGWSIGAALFAYWIESIAVGIINIPKLMIVRRVGIQDPYRTLRSTGYSVLEFIGMYGFFLMIYGVVIFKVYGLHEVELIQSILLGSAFFVSHIVSFVVHFLFEKEYFGQTVKMQFTYPLRRLVVLHAVVFFGSFFIAPNGTTHVALICVIAIKTFGDIVIHSFSHKKQLHATST